LIAFYTLYILQTLTKSTIICSVDKSTLITQNDIKCEHRREKLSDFVNIFTRNNVQHIYDEVKITSLWDLLQNLQTKGF